MSRLLPWFPLYAPNWLAEAQLLSVEARAARIGILAVVWHHGERGQLALGREVWAGLVGMDGARFERVLDELRVRQHVEIVTSAPELRLRCPELADAVERRNTQAEAKRHQRSRVGGRNAGTPKTVIADTAGMSAETPESCPPLVEGEGQEHVEEQGSGTGEAGTDAPPSSACLGPSASADAAATAPLPRTCSPARAKAQPEPPNDLRHFSRWWQLESVPEREREAQARFVDGWESLLSDLDRAYSSLDIEAELAKAYAWETANPSRRKTPRGRASFIRGWLERAQNSGARR